MQDNGLLLNLENLLKNLIMVVFNIIKSLCSIIFFIFTLVISYLLDKIWEHYSIKYVLIANVVLLFVFHPQYIEGLINIPSTLKKWEEMCAVFQLSKIKSIISIFKLAYSIIKAFIKVFFSISFKWKIRISFFIIRGLIASFIGLLVVSIIFTSVYVIIYTSLVQMPKGEIEKAYTLLGGLAISGIGIEVMKHCITKSEKIMSDELQQWLNHVKSFLKHFQIISKNSFVKFLEMKEFSKEKSEKLLQLFDYIIDMILGKSEEEQLKSYNCSIGDIVTIMAFIKMLLTELTYENTELKLVSEEEKEKIKTWWSELIEDLMEILPYSTYATITLDEIVNISYFDFKICGKLLAVKLSGKLSETEVLNDTKNDDKK
jgi:hypothetical protein